MKYNNAVTRKAAQTLPFVCAALFALFAFLYLYLFQGELIAYQQYILSHGDTTYHTFFGALIIVAMLTALGLLLQFLVRWPLMAYFMAWAPSCYILLLLTCARLPQEGVAPIDMPWVLVVVLPLLYAFALLACRAFPDARGMRRPRYLYYSANIGGMALLLLMTGLCCNADASLHRELRLIEAMANGTFQQVFDAIATAGVFTSRIPLP